MKKQDKQYFIRLDKQYIPVTEEVYKEYYRPIWRTHYHASKHGQCGCTDWRRCEGDCGLCRYRAAGNTLSLDAEYEGEEGSKLTLLDTLEDPAANPEEIIADKLMLQELFQVLDELDPDSRCICELIRQGKTEREIADEFGVRQSTLNYRKKKLIEKLREHLKNFE
jgi:RNA polymerase sigma factor (sigma-70 family)